MSMQNKPQMVEAVMFFSERGICKQMMFPEFEALLDGVVNMPEFADEQMRAVFVVINPRLLVRSVVLFLLDFDERGEADKGWNIPLRHLAERAGRGPDLGAGPIRLACRSQCPVSWHQMHLWDPNLSSTGNDLALIRDALGKRKTDNGQKAADMIVLNAGAALYAADIATSLKEGVQLAQDALHTGLAWEKLDELVSFTAVFRVENEG